MYEVCVEGEICHIFNLRMLHKVITAVCNCENKFSNMYVVHDTHLKRCVELGCTNSMSSTVTVATICCDISLA